MRILIVSDLHREHWGRYAPLIDPAPSRPDVVVLAGDIDSGHNAVDWAAATFPGLPVLYVSGNHEAYNMAIEESRQAIRDACARTGHVHYLDGDQFILGKVRFLGATLWTDFRLFGDDNRDQSMRQSEQVLADYRRIVLAGEGRRLLRAPDTARWHRQQTRWLAERLASKFDGATVVITHMAPSARSVAPRYAADLVSGAFASSLEPLAAQADLWIHGHMHDSSDYAIGRCRVVCNPCGYPLTNGKPENPAFDPNFVVELGET